MATYYRSREEISEKLKQMRETMKEVEHCGRELSKYKKKLNRLLDASPDAMVFINSDSEITMVNSQFESLFGYRQDEVRGKDLGMLIPERFRSRHNKLVKEYLKDPKPRPMGSHLEIYSLKKNGEEFPADISLSLLKTDDEFFISAAVRDITERKEAEKQAELDYFLQKTLNAMLGVSLEHNTLEKQFDKILRLILNTPHLALECKGAIYVAEEDRDILRLKASHGFKESPSSLCREIPFGECLCGRAASQAEIIHSDMIDDRHTRNRNSNIPHGHYCIPIISAGRSIGLLNIYIKEGHKRSVKEDRFLTSVANTLALIINHNKSEYEKDRLQAQLIESEKLAALGRFTANVAHEIRNPLTAIGGLARRLQKRVADGTKEEEYAGFIASEVSILEKILKKVLTYSRRTSEQREAADIHEIIDRILQLNRDSIEDKGISVKKSFAKLDDLLIDKTELYEAIENIIVNALDSMSSSGDLSVSTGKKTLKGKSYAYLKFRDTGKGMTEDQLKVIFEPFYTTKISEKGTGLGLPITKKIIEDHGGFVTVTSEAGKGSTFTLYLPAAQGTEGRDRTDAAKKL